MWFYAWYLLRGTVAIVNILLIYDVDGWAWHHMASDIVKSLGTLLMGAGIEAGRLTATVTWAF